MSLFEKTHIGQLEVKNHFIRSATYEGKATIDGRPTEAIIELYEKLAKGNIGTIITSYSYITEYEQPAKNQLGIYCDDLIEDYRKLVDRIHDCGSKIVMQIVHGSSSRQSFPDQAKIIGPSAIAHETTGIIPKEMSKEDILSVVDLFVKAAKRVQEAGFDGVQIHCAHGYFLSQFISPLYNHRSDEYGGCAENRIRIVQEVYHAIRKEVGKDYPIWIKINCSDEVPHGLTVQDFIKMAQILVKDGIDVIEVSGNAWKNHRPEESAYYKDAAIELSELVNIPIILTGGLKSLDDILPIYNNTKVQFFGFARPLMKDPNFINKL